MIQERQKRVGRPKHTCAYVIIILKTYIDISKIVKAANVGGSISLSEYF